MQKPLKTESVQVAEHLLPLFEGLSRRRSLLDERVVRSVGRGVGFRSSDEKVYKLLSVLAEKHLGEILASINHKNVAAIGEIQRKMELAQKDMKTTPKKLHGLLRVLMGRRVLTLQEALVELRERPEFVHKAAQLPRENFS